MLQVNISAIDSDNIEPFVKKLQAFLKKYKGKAPSFHNKECALELYRVVNQIPGVCNNINLRTNTNIIYNNGQGFLRAGSTLAHIAVCCNLPILIDFFFNRNGRINSCNDDQETPLHIALRLNNIDMAMHILQYAPHDPDGKELYEETRPIVSQQNADGNSILHVVVEMQTDDLDNVPNNYEPLLNRVMELFHAEGSNFNLPNYHGNTVAHMAVLSNNGVALEKLLRVDKVDFLHVNHDKNNVLQLICSKKSGVDFDALSEQLILNLCNPQDLESIAADNSGGNFLTVCVRRGAFNTIKIALQTWGTSGDGILRKMLCKKNQHQRTPLDIAVCSIAGFDIDLIEALLSVDLPGSVIRDALIKFIYHHFRHRNKKASQGSLSVLQVEKALLCLMDKAELRNDGLQWNILHCLAKANELPKYAVEIVLKCIHDGKAIQEQPSFLQPDKHGNNPLHLAIQYDNETVFLAILSAYDKYFTINDRDGGKLDNEKCSLTSVNNSELNIAQLAMQNSNKKIFMAIARRIGAPMLLKGVMGNKKGSLLHLVLLEKKFDLAMELLDFLQSNTDHKELVHFILQLDSSNMSIAHLVCQKGGEELFLKLYSVTPDMLHAKNNALETPLGLAFKAGMEEVIQGILQSRKDVLSNWIDNNPEYAASCIAQSMNIANLQLIDCNETVRIVIAKKMFAEAIKQGSIGLVVELIQQYPAVLQQQLNTDYSEGMSALHLAASLGKIDVIKVLIAQGAKIEATDNNGNTIMHILLQDYIENKAHNRSNTQNEQVLNLLLGYNVNVALLNAQKQSIVSLIIQTGNKFLLSRALESLNFGAIPCISHDNVLQAVKIGPSKYHFCKLLQCKAAQGNRSMAEAITPDMVSSVAKDQIELKRFMCFHKGLWFAIKHETGFFAPIVATVHYLKNFFEWHFVNNSKENNTVTSSGLGLQQDLLLEEVSGHLTKCADTDLLANNSVSCKPLPSNKVTDVRAVINSTGTVISDGYVAKGA